MDTFHFRILDPRKASDSPDSVALTNQLYQTWKKAFSKVVEEAGGKLDPDDYFRNNFALVVYDKDQILGFSLCTEFDLRLQSSEEHHYWKVMEPETIRRLKEKGINRLMSMEYFTVLPDWRQMTRRQTSWAEVLVGLGLLYQDRFPIDAMVGTPRADIRISGLSERMGGQSVQAPIMKMNYPCDVQVFSKLPPGRKRTFSNLLTHKWVHELWENRLDMRTDIGTEIATSTKAA